MEVHFGQLPGRAGRPHLSGSTAAYAGNQSVAKISHALPQILPNSKVEIAD
jgi:hypothetical protein